jgi:ADP-ribosylglycohydrolase
MFPDKMPFNDDLDLQVLWLKVLEEKGPALASDDLAQAWLEGCWYPFNEYGIFRRNWQLGIHAPYSGQFGNQFFNTGMGCPIRAEIWGYIFPGAPDLAAKYAEIDGQLDHGAESVGAEKMFAAMSSMAFFISDVKRLSEMFIHHLPPGSRIERLVRMAFRCHETGVPLREARDRILLAGGNSEGADAIANVPFTFLGLLYGNNDLEATMHAALNCGYDTDCTMATSGALLGQIMGAKRIPGNLKDPVGDELVMGIQYKRREMTLSALARDTARVGCLFSQHFKTVEIKQTPLLVPFPDTARFTACNLVVDYEGLPSAAPGDLVRIKIKVEGDVPPNATLNIVAQNPGWVVTPSSILHPTASQREFSVSLQAPALNSPDANPWPQKHLFTATLRNIDGVACTYTFGVSGAALYQFLGAYYDPAPTPGDFEKHPLLQMAHHFVSMKRNYLPEPQLSTDKLYVTMENKLGVIPLIASHEHELDATSLIGLQGAYCLYLARTFISPEARDAVMIVGNNDSFRAYLNDDLVAEENEVLMWSPFNNIYQVRLKKGPNRLLLKLLKRSDVLRCTLGFRNGKSEYFHTQDWLVDLADAVPGYELVS